MEPQPGSVLSITAKCNSLESNINESIRMYSSMPLETCEDAIEYILMNLKEGVSSTPFLILDNIYSVEPNVKKANFYSDSLSEEDFYI